MFVIDIAMDGSALSLFLEFSVHPLCQYPHSLPLIASPSVPSIQSLVDTVDELIDLVSNWNVVHCSAGSTPHKLKSKKRAHPKSISMEATPAKKSKLNAKDFEFRKIARNCQFNLEAEARNKLCALTAEAIKTVYDLDLDEKQQHELLVKGLARPSHGRGEVTLPCFRLSKPLKSKPTLIAEKLVEEISKAIKAKSGVLFLSNPFLKVEAANGRINAYLTAAYLGACNLSNSLNFLIIFLIILSHLHPTECKDL